MLFIRRSLRFILRPSTFQLHPNRSCMSKTHDETPCAMPPLDPEAILDKSKCERIVPVLLVGLACDRSWKTTSAAIERYFLDYIHIPRKFKTYKDASGTLRKLLLIQPPLDAPLSTSASALREHNIDVNVDPYTKEELTSWNVCPTDSPRHLPCDLPTGLSDEAPLLSTQALDSLERPGTCLLRIGYENLKLDDALKVILPNQVLPISGFTVMGHIAHFNLKEDALPFRRLIGQIILDKLPGVRTVIHKSATINTDYRTFEFELLAGVPEFVTVVKERNCLFHFDASKVYWNSRLGTEHGRIIDQLCTPFNHTNHEPLRADRVVVYDVFAGVGPFAIPAARLGCREVLANDLNPDSHTWLVHNVQANTSKRKPLTNIRVFNLDGREFIREILIPHYKASTLDACPPLRYVVLMNLPALAPDFLDAFRPDPSCAQPNCDHIPPLDIFCYCFLKRNIESEQTAQARIAKALGFETAAAAFSEPKPGHALELRQWRLRFVRNVAPFKDMFCAQFQLSIPITEASTQSKKPKLD